MRKFPQLGIVIAFSLWAGALTAFLCVGSAASAQTGNSAMGAAPATSSSGSSSENSQSSSGSSTAGYSSPSAQSPFYGSVPEGKATAEVLPLSIKDAIDRGLRNNLGVLLQGDTTLNARGQRWRELSALLPNVSAQATESALQINLAAQGLRFKLPGTSSTIVGPIGVFDSRVYLTQSVFNYNLIEKARSASASETAAKHSYQDARELVVLAVGNLYLQTIATAARVASTAAQVETAKALYDKSSAQQQAGISPAIDALRARVEYQTRQQQLIVSKNDFAKQKLSLARAIGLPPGQEFTLSDDTPYQPLTALSVEESLQRAYNYRSDYKAASQQLRAAQLSLRAAAAERYPSLGIAGNYGDSGVNIGNSHGVFEVGATLQIPIFQGGKAHGDILQAEATMRQSRQQLENLRGQIDYDVRTALLDLAAAADQVEVARSNVELAGETLTQARDRFTAGVTDNLEVVQAQETLATANENYISSLYSHNLAKISLARAIGYAEEGVKNYLKSK